MAKKINSIETGKRIKEIADIHGYTPTALGNKLFLSKFTIYKWYAGVNIPRIDDFIALSDLLGVTIDELIVCDEVV